MKNSNIFELNETSDSQTSLQEHHFHHVYELSAFFHKTNKSCLLELFHNQTTSGNRHNLPIQKEFNQKNHKNIVILASDFQQKEETRSEIPLAKKPKVKSKDEKKNMQKLSRNVISNILRIFFKNTIEVKYYDSLIETVIGKFNAAITKSQFYAWMNSFGINFKNYIRYNQLQKLFKAPKALFFQKILSILLEQFFKKYALNHCLTSKRIEQSSVRMHLDGIRILQKELSVYKQML